MATDYPKRKNIRLPYYDYSREGVYFITICTEQKAKLLCNILAPRLEGDAPNVSLTPVGRVVDEMIQIIPGIDKYVIMPNHIHMLIMNRAGDSALSRKIQYFKSNVTRKLGKQIWQRNYYEYVIRAERDYLIRWKYIDDNPAKWASDEYYC